jgi:hypothetical protein
MPAPVYRRRQPPWQQRRRFKRQLGLRELRATTASLPVGLSTRAGVSTVRQVGVPVPIGVIFRVAGTAEEAAPAVSTAVRFPVGLTIRSTASAGRPTTVRLPIGAVARMGVATDRPASVRLPIGVGTRTGATTIRAVQFLVPAGVTFRAGAAAEEIPSISTAMRFPVGVGVRVGAATGRSATVVVPLGVTARSIVATVRPSGLLVPVGLVTLVEVFQPSLGAPIIRSARERVRYTGRERHQPSGREVAAVTGKEH